MIIYVTFSKGHLMLFCGHRRFFLLLFGNIMYFLYICTIDVSLAQEQSDS